MLASAPTSGPTRQRTKRVEPIAVYQPLPWQIAPWLDTHGILLLTGSAGGGKSRFSAEKLHGYCLRYPNAMGMAIRKTKVSMTSGLVLMMERRVIGRDPRVKHFPSKARFEYSNGSILAYGGLADEEQRKRLRSIGQDGSLDIVWMEEAIEFEEEDLNEVLARRRGRAAPWRQIMLSTNPDAPTHWINRRLIEGGEAHVYYSSASDNPYNPADYEATLAQLTGVEGERLREGKWVQASGIVYEGWSELPDGNVTEDADYQEGNGTLLWAVDDGYAGEYDARSGSYTANSHPRVFLLCQLRPTGQLCIFAEVYAIKTLPEQHITQVRALGYPDPDYAVVDKSAAALKGRLQAEGIYTRNGPASVEESIKVMREWVAPDSNGVRKLLVHPRCRLFRREMVSYRRAMDGGVIKEHDHGPDAARYLIWALRYEA